MTNSTIKRRIAEAYIKTQLDLIDNKYYTDGKTTVFWCQNNSSDLDEAYFPISYCFDEDYSYELEIDWDSVFSTTNFTLLDLIEDYLNQDPKTSEEDKQTRDKDGNVFDWVWALTDDAINWASGSKKYSDTIAEIEQEEKERLIDWAEATCNLETAKEIATQRIM